MEENIKYDGLDHCYVKNCVDDSCSLDSYLNFGDIMEIGDEVTVTDFPLTDYTDHSYISTSKALRNNTTIRFNDHDSEESTLPEFHELFDFGSDYPSYQEQVIESSVHSIDDINQIQSHHQWMYPESRESIVLEDVQNDEDDTSSGCETEPDKFNRNNNGEQQQQQQQNGSSNHHTGPFPHTFIPMPGDRRIRFCLGLQTIITKIKTLMARTGATAPNFRAEFESHVFTLDNAEKVLKFPHRSQQSNGKTGHANNGLKISEPTTFQSLSNSNGGGQDDHLYAATILTQTESSSSVRDHQYNEVTTTNHIGKKNTIIEKAYIPTRYARERWLRKGTTTIYTKMQRLKNRTGAKMALTMNYQGIIITSKNYRELDKMLEKYRSKLKKYNTEIIIQNNNEDDEENFLSTESMKGVEGHSLTDKRIGTVMKVSLPHKKAKNFQIEFLKIEDKNNLQLSSTDQTLRTNLKTVESDHDYDSQSIHEPKRAKLGPRSNSDISDNSNSSSSTNSHHSFSETFSPPSPPSVISVEEVSVSDGDVGLTADCSGDTISSSTFFSFCSSPKAQCSTLQKSPPSPIIVETPSSSSLSSAVVKMDVSTSTDPCCGICGDSQVSISEKHKFPSFQGKFPNWIRCAHALCHYLVHPYCIGFFVTNSQHLQFLPPYFCPTHREDGFS